MCLGESVSGLDTNKLTNRTALNADLGIFQIQSKDWCKFKRVGGKCGLKCEGMIIDKRKTSSFNMIYRVSFY